MSFTETMVTFGKENAINAYIFYENCVAYTLCKNISLLRFISQKNNGEIICVPKQN